MGEGASFCRNFSRLRLRVLVIGV